MYILTPLALLSQCAYTLVTLSHDMTKPATEQGSGGCWLLNRGYKLSTADTVELLTCGRLLLLGLQSCCCWRLAQAAAAAASQQLGGSAAGVNKHGHTGHT
jgi:hypothetical protein